MICNISFVRYQFQVIVCHILVLDIYDSFHILLLPGNDFLRRPLIFEYLLLSFRFQHLCRRYHCSAYLRQTAWSEFKNKTSIRTFAGSKWSHGNHTAWFTSHQESVDHGLGIFGLQYLHFQHLEYLEILAHWSLTHHLSVRQLNLQSHQLIEKRDLDFPSILHSLFFACYSAAQHLGFHCEDLAVPKNKIISNASTDWLRIYPTKKYFFNKR